MSVFSKLLAISKRDEQSLWENDEKSGDHNPLLNNVIING